MCTTVLAGKKATIDGSTMIARNCDGETPIAPVKFIVVPENDQQTGTYQSYVTGFQMPYPKKAMRYQMVPFVDETKLGIFGEAGFNSANVGMSSTESIYGNPRVLAIDPLLESGIGEDSLLSMVLPYIHSAREGVEYLGKIIQEHGSHEGNGIIFSDKDEVWYMEIPCGHHWVAQKLPEDHVAVIANQVSQQEIDFSDNENFLWSEGIQEFVEKNHLNPDPDCWNFRRIFGTSTGLDRRYNTPRVWFGQNYLGLQSDDPSCNDLPFSFKADRKVTQEDVAYVLSSHYNETAFDPLGDAPEDTRKKYRPIAIRRTAESHILQVRNHVPEEIAAIFWINNAPTAFNPYVPFYANANDTAPAYHETSMKFDFHQAYWISRVIAVLVERSFADQETIDTNYLTAAQQTANNIVATIDAQARDQSASEMTEFLTKANAQTAEKMNALALDTINQLVQNGMELSALMFNANTDLNH